MPMHIKKISNLKYKILAVGYTLWLTAVSLTPLNDLDLPSFKFADKIVHFFLYFFLTLLWILALQKLQRIKIRLLIFIILWGIIIEFLQEYFIPGRSGDIFDAVANTIGSISAIFLCVKYQSCPK
jgi:VanZ family protein